ncbi:MULTISPECIES: PssE/Cps14G family polysaccharide biosynthesis glycosyltransferase [Bacillaceae]|uniref:PssE/Cps14G family polysaccharide biosynthesis glycosyltransferase n=1 Tax=Bacillaceae TaxID=186817 RepID=UPI000BFDCBFB|nr:MULTISPECIES: PssE/Cps14G family polysaccharide biosynthesis glycosyltransferase [Bacillaceae]PGT82982.1 beta(1,3)galactosyltransferase EpsH [Bacillus sp. AFS040349]UGB29478.1 beta(1,3)galactosyltransferase EpsH [Metabacillus sp. B2-18]
MIFVTVGSQKFQFNRLLEEIDHLIQKKVLKSDEIFAQIGYSTYEPNYYSFKPFLNKDEFMQMIDKSSIIITHGGTGSIITAVKKGKVVIGVPRKKEFGEHVDNHQSEILEQFSNSKIIYAVSDITDIESAIKQVENLKFRKYESNTKNIISIIEKFLQRIT